MHSSDYRQQYCIKNIKHAKGLDLNYSHHKNKMITMGTDSGVS